MLVPEGTSISFQISSGVTDDENPTGDLPNEMDPAGSESLPGIASQVSVSVDLSSYTEPVQIRVDVGGFSQYESQVDPALGTFHRTITGTGIQQVVIYVNGVVERDLWVDFDA